MAFLGGVFGIGIGYRIAFWKVERSLGEFCLYDKASREKGKPMFYTDIVMTLVWRFLLTMAGKPS